MRDYSRNESNLRYVPKFHSFDFISLSQKIDMKKALKAVFKDPNTRIICNEETFSARDKASQRFLNTKFFDLMLKSLDMKDEYDIIRCMNGFKTMSIDFDAYYHQRDMISKINANPGRYVDSQTPVCYIFNQKLSDVENRYTFELYFKARIKQDKEGHYEVHVMSLHWGDPNDKEHPYKVLNKITKQYDDIGTVMEYLRNTYERNDHTRGDLR